MELVNHIQMGKKRVLDVGCAEGRTGEYIKSSGLAQEVIGVEVDENTARIARERIDEVFCIDLNKVSLKSEPALAAFDYILCGDVLEHLIDPWQVLADLKAMLNPGGAVVASVPNVRYLDVILPLLFAGEWRYQPQGGILDQTHLRFFTRSSLIDLFSQCGFNNTIITPKISRRRDKWLNRATFGMLSGLFTYQWIVLAKT